MITSSYNRELVCRVADIMKTPVLSVNGNDSILELAQTMIDEKPKVYPVLDDTGAVIGTINRTEVLNAIDVQLHSGYTSKGK
jgi:CBS domain-containing protein